MNDRISHSGLEATVRYELHVRLDSLPRHNKLCHGDFNPSNVLVDENGKYYILDWAHATQGNASADAATTYIQFLLTGDKASAEYYLKAFCKKQIQHYNMFKNGCQSLLQHYLLKHHQKIVQLY